MSIRYSVVSGLLTTNEAKEEATKEDPMSTTANTIANTIYMAYPAINKRTEPEAFELPIDQTATLAHVAEEWRDLQARADDARESVAAAARTAHANGMSAYRIGKVTGAAPDTIRKWLKES